MADYIDNIQRTVLLKHDGAFNIVLDSIFLVVLKGFSIAMRRPFPRLQMKG